MKRVCYAIGWMMTVVAVMAVHAADGQALFPGGDFTMATKSLLPLAVSNGGRVSLYEEDRTWNKCGKLEVLTPTTNDDGASVWDAMAIIGSTDGKESGLAVESGKSYDFSMDVRGDKDLLTRVAVYAWNAGLWEDGKRIQTTLAPFHLKSGWTTYKGTFKVPEGKTSAGLVLQLWASSKYPPVKVSEGDCLYFDNVKVEEVMEGFSALGGGKGASVRPVVPRKALASGVEARDFLLYDGKTGARGATEDLAATVTLAEDALRIDYEIRSAKGFRPGTDKSVWSGDAMEVIFGSTATKCDRDFTHIAWNAAGAKSVASGGHAKTGFDIVSNEVSGDTWKCSVNVPLATLGFDRAPLAGEEIALNIAFSGAQAGFCASWAPVTEGFKDVAKFGSFVFGTYGEALHRRYAVPVRDLDRQEFETEVAARETAASRAKFAALQDQPFTVAVLPVDTDYACPFVPRESFHPVTNIAVKGAVNEKVGLPVAVLNLTDQPETYVVRIETDTADPENGWAEKQLNGTWGLKGFPAKQLVAREALRFRDTENEPVTLRLEQLPMMNEACTVVVPPKEAGLVWFDFDTADVKPGVYRGRLRVIPFSPAAKWKLYGGSSYHKRQYEGRMQDIPVSLEVRPIVLAKRPALPAGFFQNATTEGQFALMADVGTRDFQLQPWDFNWELTADGRHFDLTRPSAKLANAERNVREMLAWAQARGFRPTFFIGFSVFETFQSMNNLSGDFQRSLELWPEYLRGMKTSLNAWGLADGECALEMFDEPDPKRFDEMRQVLETARQAVPDVRLLVTLGARTMSAEDMRRLDPLVDTWVLWRHGYFSRPEHLDYIADALRRGKQVWHYTCDGSARSRIYPSYRLHPWFGYRHGLTGNQFFIFQEMTGGYGPADFKCAASAGIVYKSFESTMPSLRYMSMRRGAEDLKYLEKLREVAGDVPEVGRFLAEAPVTVVDAEGHDTSAADRMRERAAELIMKYQEGK